MVGHAEQHLVEDTAGFPGPHHVDEDGREDARMLCERIGEGLAGLDVLAYVGDHVAKRRVLSLLAEDRQTLRQRESGVDHRGELPSEDRHVLRFDAAADLDLADALQSALRLQVEDDVAHLNELGPDDLLAVALELALDDLAGPIAHRVVVNRHSAHSLRLTARSVPTQDQTITRATSSIDVVP